MLEEAHEAPPTRYPKDPFVLKTPIVMEIVVFFLLLRSYFTIHANSLSISQEKQRPN